MKSRILWWLGVTATTLLVLWLLSLAYFLWEWGFLTGGSEVVDARHHTIVIRQLVRMRGPFDTPLWLCPACLLLTAVACFGLSKRRRPAVPTADVKG